MDFVQLVDESIGYILRSSGFELIRTGSAGIEYNYKRIQLSFAYDFNRSFEVSFDLSFNAGKEFYTIQEWSKLIPFNSHEINYAIQIVDQDELRAWFEKVNEFLFDRLEYMLQNATRLEKQFLMLQKNMIEEYARDEDDRCFNEDLNKYWQKKDYKGLIKLVSEYKGDLSRSTKLKFEYAIKKVGTN